MCVSGAAGFDLIVLRYIVTNALLLEWNSVARASSFLWCPPPCVVVLMPFPALYLLRLINFSLRSSRQQPVASSVLGTKSGFYSRQACGHKEIRVTGHALSDTLSQNSSFICQVWILSLYEGHITASILCVFYCFAFALRCILKT